MLNQQTMKGFKQLRDQLHEDSHLAITWREENVPLT